MKRDRYAMNIQEPDMPGWTMETSNKSEEMLALARTMRRKYLRVGIRVTVYDVVQGVNVYDNVVREHDTNT